jgi:predicted amidophosphoribosyltransferase
MTRYEDHEDEWREENFARREYNRRSHSVCPVCGWTLTHHAQGCPEDSADEAEENP